MLDTRGAISSRAEVVVIGGGLAGLAAARRLAEQSIHVVVLEAHHRLEFVHGVPGATHDLAREAQLELDTVAGSHFLLRGGRLARAGDVWERFGELLARAPDAAHDESARAYQGTVAGAQASGSRAAREVAESLR